MLFNWKLAFKVWADYVFIVYDIQVLYCHTYHRGLLYACWAYSDFNFQRKASNQAPPP